MHPKGHDVVLKYQCRQAINRPSTHYVHATITLYSGYQFRIQVYFNMKEVLNGKCIKTVLQMENPNLRPSESAICYIVHCFFRIRCVRATKARMTKNQTAMANCACFPPCDEVAYDVSYSLSKWPAAG